MRLIIEILFLVVLLIIIIINAVAFMFIKKLSEKENETQLSGFEIARQISSKNNNELHIIKKKGRFLDHYNLDRNVIKLSPEVFDGTDIYAAIISLNTALETDKEKEIIPKGHRLSNYLVLASYILIIAGAFLNNYSIITFGLVIFILAFILEILIFNNILNEFKNTDLYKYIEDENIIKPFIDNKEYIIILNIISIARLPYGFINFFR